MVLMRDITERKRAERELRRRDAILAALGAASLFSSLLGCDEVEGCPFRFSAVRRPHREYQFHPTKMGSSPTSPGGEPLVISRHGYLASRMVENSGDGS